MRAFSGSAGIVRRLGAALATLGLLAGFAGPVRGQDAVERGFVVWKEAGCGACHGTFAEGRGAGLLPRGSNLRRTPLYLPELIETIGCGRPGTNMPFHLIGAYTQSECFGMRGEVPPGTFEGAHLTAEQIADLGEYLWTRIIGLGPVTRDECVAYYGNPAEPACQQYR